VEEQQFNTTLLKNCVKLVEEDGRANPWRRPINHSAPFPSPGGGGYLAPPWWIPPSMIDVVDERLCYYDTTYYCFWLTSAVDACWKPSTHWFFTFIHLFQSVTLTSFQFYSLFNRFLLPPPLLQSMLLCLSSIIYLPLRFLHIYAHTYSLVIPWEVQLLWMICYQPISSNISHVKNDGWTHIFQWLLVITATDYWSMIPTYSVEQLPFLSSPFSALHY
jgi:hypothetical protein